MQGRLGELTKQVNNIVPASRAAGTVNGAAIDTLGYGAVRSTLATGAIDAGITDVDLKLQDSADGSTGWADITGAAIATLDGGDDDDAPAIDVLLGGRAAGTIKRYIREVLVIAGTGNVLCGVMTELYEAESRPVTNSPATVLV